MLALRYSGQKICRSFVSNIWTKRTSLSRERREFDLPEALQILPSDNHILKTYGNAFNKTELLSKLKELDVDTIILSGYCAEFCVLATYRGAEDMDLTPILLRSALVSGKAENIGFVESISEVISYGALKKVLG